MVEICLILLYFKSNVLTKKKLRKKLIYLLSIYLAFFVACCYQSENINPVISFSAIYCYPVLLHTLIFQPVSCIFLLLLQNTHIPLHWEQPQNFEGKKITLGNGVPLGKSWLRAPRELNTHEMQLPTTIKDIREAIGESLNRWEIKVQLLI